jgi:hypothetical protein
MSFYLVILKFAKKEMGAHCFIACKLKEDDAYIFIYHYMNKCRYYCYYTAAFCPSFSIYIDRVARSNLCKL